jgi:hypothetical protein
MPGGGTKDKHKAPLFGRIGLAAASGVALAGPRWRFLPDPA